MPRFIPGEKLGNKASRQLDNRKRQTWPIPPVAKTFTSKKEYSRKRKSCDYQNDWSRGFFCGQTTQRTSSGK